MKVAVYCRVSTDDKGQDPQVQLDKCKQYCELHGHTIESIYIDEGVSGDTFFYDRPEGKKLYQLINRNRIEGICCFAIDRFSRQNPLKILPLIKSLKDRGITFISVTEPIFNMEGSMAEPMQYFLAWFSNYFLKQHKEKVNAGIVKAQKYGTKSGKSIGRQRKVNYDTIRAYYEQGMSMSGISKKMGISKSSVSNAINGSKKKSF